MRYSGAFSEGWEEGGVDDLEDSKWKKGERNDFCALVYPPPPNPRTKEISNIWKSHCHRFFRCFQKPFSLFSFLLMKNLMKGIISKYVTT